MIYFNKNNFHRLISLVLICFCTSITSVNAQTTKIQGKVIDNITKEPLPFVNLLLKGTKVGTITDFNGNYKIETKGHADSIIVSYLGYKSQTKKVVRNRFQTINFELSKDILQLEEVVIVADKKAKNPAIEVFQNIIKHKNENNYDNLDYYEYEVYNKIQFDLNNITEDFTKRKVLKPFDFVFDYIDTSLVNGKPYLPVFIIESISDYAYRKKPKNEKEEIKATKVAGIENESIQQFLGDMYINTNIYDNYIDLFGKGFVSPISSSGRVFYKYFLIDSAFIDNDWCFHMVFKPRMKQEFVFNGNFWVTDTTFAIKKIEMSIDTDVNINFINNLEIKKEFAEVEEDVWMETKDIVVVDFNILENPKKAFGFFGRKTTTYKDHTINKSRDPDFYSISNNIIVAEDADKKDDAYWESSRHEDLSNKEQTIYNMIDTLKDLPAFRTYLDVINVALTGYYVWNYVELGPYFTTYSYNEIEGNRFRIGGRTSNKFSTRLLLDGYCAYGTLDTKFKYGGGFLYLLNKNPRKGFGFSYKNDMEQLGQSINAYREDNILSSVLRRAPNNKLSMVEEYKPKYEHEWFNGFSNKLSFTHRDISPISGVEFKFLENGESYTKPTLTTAEVTLSTRFAYNEKFVMGEFRRISLGTTFPIVEVFLTHGFKNDFFNSNFNYDKLNFTISDVVNIYPFGYSRYIIEGGQIWGTLPYPLLKLHEGNATYSFDQYSFNMMNYYEFVSDRYLSVYYTHHFEGLFLNKMPLFKKLKWREVVWTKGVIGSLTDKNTTIMTFPDNLYSLSKPGNPGSIKPYWEGGVGIENIFKFLRVDAVWRLAYLDHPNISKFGIRTSMKFKF